MIYQVYNIRLDLHDSASQAVITATRRDTKRRLAITLVDNNKPYEIEQGCYAVFTAEKSDGNPLYNGCVISGNTITYDFTEQTTAAVGALECRIMLYGAEHGLITSPRFTIVVVDEPYDTEDELTSTAEYSALTALVNEVNRMMSDGEFNGEDGFSPTVKIAEIAGGHRVTITSAEGDSIFDITDGIDGIDGDDGYSPTVKVTEIAGGHRVAITSASGEDTFDIIDGIDGIDGNDGYSPTVKVDEITDGHRVTITSADGEKSFDVMDGVSVADVSQTVKSDEDEGDNEITVELSDGEKSTFYVKNGSRGSQGVSIESIKQTVVSEEDGGENQVEITLTNGEKSTIVLRNGNPGLPGDANLAPPIVENAEGEVISVSDSAERPLQGLRVFGKTEQFTTTGKNLLPYPYVDTTHTHNGITYTDNGDGSITMIGTATADSYFVLSENYLFGETNIGKNSSNGSYTSSGNASYNASNGKASLNFSAGDEINKTVFPMIRLASVEDDTYEPYTGGKPSPSPEYPQELESVVSPSVAVTGKNLFDNSSTPTGSYGTSVTVLGTGVRLSTTMVGAYLYASYVPDINVETGKKYVLSFSAKASAGGEPAALLRVFDANGNSLIVNNTIGNGDCSVAVIAPENSADCYLRVTLYANREGAVAVGDYVDYTNLQLEISDTATAYEPYKNGGTLALANTLHGIPVDSGGNYTDEDGQQWICDEVDFARGVFVQRVAGYVITGAEAWRVSGVQKVENGVRYDALTGLAPALLTNTLCNYFPYNGSNEKGTWALNGGIELSLRIAWDYATVEDLTAFLTEKYSTGDPVTVKYALTAPVETDLTAEEMAQYEALRTQKPNTVIMNDGEAYMSADYVADTKIYIDNKFAELSAAIVNNA